MTKPDIHCAVYTRKSSEEGLEQSFNSLEAQREACVAYVDSQKHEGWVLLKDQYDDGGFSGGSMDRPGLKRLLVDISAGKVQTVIVYKVDRLTRSLADFAKIIEVFDSHKASFVSVTQQFNTTTSMGRLTLNVLLSFAQFERELTGERIRDKVAASKKKGMWMGGTVPLGYDCSGQRLIVNQEAKTVREIFVQYLRLGSVKKLKDYLDREQIHSKLRTSRQGRTSGGSAFARGALYHLLSNRTYIGEVVHRGQRYVGQQEAIIDRELWDQVAARLKANNQAHRSRKSTSTPSMLTGILFDPRGVRFTPTHAVKSGKRYRYYTSQVAIRKTGQEPAVSRLPAQELETLIISQIHLLLECPDKWAAAPRNNPEVDEIKEQAQELAKNWHKLETSKQHEFVRRALRKVTVGQTTVWIEVDGPKLAEVLLGQKPESHPADKKGYPPTIKLTVDFQPLRRGGELRLVVPTSGSIEGSPIPSLVKATARARDWYERIVSGEVGTVVQLAKKVGLPLPYVKRILKCAVLSPQMTEAVLSGKHSPSLTLQDLLQNVPINWPEQNHGILLPRQKKGSL